VLSASRLPHLVGPGGQASDYSRLCQLLICGPNDGIDYWIKQAPVVKVERLGETLAIESRSTNFSV
jgi:hypothetical protein